MKIILVAIILLSVLSCDRRVDVSAEKVIFVDLSKQREISINDYVEELVTLNKDGESIALGIIKKLLPADECYIIADNNLVSMFDSEDGKFITSFSMKGRANSEYLGISDIWLENDTLLLYDFIDKKILVFDDNGVLIRSRLLNSKTTEKPFCALVPYKDGYIGRRVYSNPNITPELALYNSEFEYLNDLISDVVKSGMYLSYPFATTSKGDILYNRYFQNEIFTIDNSGNFNTKYYIDFMENNVPKHIEFKDEYEMLEFVNKDKDKYATLIANFYETDDYMCLRYLYQAEKRFLIYDKKNEVTTPFTVTDDENYKVSDFYFNGDKVICYLEREENSAILSLEIEDILKQ